MEIKRTRILWVRLIVYSLVIGTTALLIHQKWNQQAYAVFKEALLQELQKRDTLSTSNESNWKVISVLEEVTPETVSIVTDLLVIVGACAGLELLFFIMGRKSFYRENRQTEKSESKDLPVVVVTAKQSSVYQVGKNVFFDAERMELIKQDMVVKIAPQIAVMLEMFLLAERHTLSMTEISEILWPDGDGSRERIHTLIRRLRKSIAESTSLQIIYQKDAYHLIIPDFIEEKRFSG